MTERINKKQIEYELFKRNIPLASSQMLRTISMMEIDLIANDILLIIDKKYKLKKIPTKEQLQNILETIFLNSIIRSEGELRLFLDDTKNNSNTIKAMELELDDLTNKIKTIYNKETTTCYSDFSRRSIEQITGLIKSINEEEVNLKMKMKIKEILDKRLQDFLDGAYKAIHTQVIMNMKRQLDQIKEEIK